MKNPNGFGSVIKLGGKRRRKYAARITVDWTKEGKQKFKYIGYYYTKSEAITALSDFNKNPYDLKNNEITFEQIYNDWSKEKFDTLAVSSVNSYKVSFKKCKDLHNKIFKDLKKQDLQELIDLEKENSESVKKHLKALFLQLYKYAIENDITEKDYAKFVKIPVSKGPKKDKVPFTSDEIKLIEQNLWKVKGTDIIVILLYTGMRINELFTMKKENVNLSEKIMVGGSKTKAGKNRAIPIHDRIYPIIEYHYNNSKGDFLVSNSKGNQIDYPSFISRQWKKIMQDFGMDHTPHETRHTFISKMNTLNVNTLVVKRIVGHADKDITEHYTHKDNKELLNTINLLSYYK